MQTLDNILRSYYGSGHECVRHVPQIYAGGWMRPITLCCSRRYGRTPATRVLAAAAHGKHDRSGARNQRTRVEGQYVDGMMAQTSVYVSPQLFPGLSQFGSSRTFQLHPMRLPKDASQTSIVLIANAAAPAVSLLVPMLALRILPQASLQPRPLQLPGAA